MTEQVKPQRPAERVHDEPATLAIRPAALAGALPNKESPAATPVPAPTWAVPTFPWTKVFSTACLAAATVVAAAPWVIESLSKWASTTSCSTIVASDVLIVGFALLLKRNQAFGESGLSKLLENPPPAFVASVALALVGWFWTLAPSEAPPEFHKSLENGVGLLPTLVPLLGLLVARLLRERRLEKRALNAPKPPAPNGPPDSFAEIVRWISTDDDIKAEADDRFGHSTLAGRIVDTIRRARVGRESTFALIGQTGSGKSSVLSLVRARLEQLGLLNESIVVVSVSLWPFESGDAAIRGVLSAVRKGLGALTTTIDVAGSATRYLSLIKKLDNRLDTLSEFLGGEKSPKDALDAYDTLAARIGVRLVVWIEDLERFWGGDWKETSAIRALLHQLQQLDHVTVVVATAHVEGSLLDPEKIARYVEVIPALDPERVWPILQRFREGATAAYPNDVPLEVSRPSVFAQQANNPFMSMEQNRRTMPGAITYLSSTPRVLKQVLRAAHETWQRVHGEVSLEDVILVSIVRAARPRLFAMIERHIDTLRDGGSSPNAIGRRRANGRTAFEEEFDTEFSGSADYGPAKEMIDALFPHRTGGSASPPQRLAARSPRNYWLRYLSGAPVLEGERDQTLLAAVRDCRAGSSAALKSALAAHDKGDAAAHFATALPWPILLDLLDGIALERIAEPQASWPQDVFGPHPPGLIPIWQALQRHRNHGAAEKKALAERVAKILERTVPRNLALAQAIQYWFFDSDSRERADLIGEPDADALRELVIRMLLQFRGRPEELHKALDGSTRWVLGWISFGMKRVRDDSKWKELPFAAWPSLAPTVLDAAESHRAALIPTILALVTRFRDFSNGTREPVFDEDTAMRLFDIHRLRQLIEAPETKAISWPADDQAMLDAALEGLRAREQSAPSGPALPPGG